MVRITRARIEDLAGTTCDSDTSLTAVLSCGGLAPWILSRPALDLALGDSGVPSGLERALRTALTRTCSEAAPGSLVVTARWTGVDRNSDSVLGAGLALPLRWIRSEDRASDPLLPQSLIEQQDRVLAESGRPDFLLAQRWPGFAGLQVDLRDLRIDGESAWLPLRCGLVSADLGIEVHPHVAATGTWSPANRTSQVGGVLDKAQHLVGLGYTEFVVPNTSIDPGDCSGIDITQLDPVANQELLLRGALARILRQPTSAAGASLATRLDYLNLNLGTHEDWESFYVSQILDDLATKLRNDWQLNSTGTLLVIATQRSATELAIRVQPSERVVLLFGRDVSPWVRDLQGPTTTLVEVDPHDPEEVAAKLTPALGGGGPLVANVTGGTTAMKLTAACCAWSQCGDVVSIGTARGSDNSPCVGTEKLIHHPPPDY